MSQAQAHDPQTGPSVVELETTLASPRDRIRAANELAGRWRTLPPPHAAFRLAALRAYLEEVRAKLGPGETAPTFTELANDLQMSRSRLGQLRAKLAEPQVMTAMTTTRGRCTGLHDVRGGSAASDPDAVSEMAQESRTQTRDLGEQQLTEVVMARRTEPAEAADTRTTS